MWRQIAHALRNLCYWGFPAGTAILGVYFTHRATVYEGWMSERAYVFGIALILGTWAWTASRSSRRRTAEAAQWEDDKQKLTARIRELERRIGGIMQALDAYGAATEILDVLHPLAADIPHRRDPDDGDASVIHLDPQTGS